MACNISSDDEIYTNTVYKEKKREQEIEKCMIINRFFI